MKTVVVGGTGRVGTKLVRVLSDHDVGAVVASRASGVDTTTGSGLAEVLEGASVVIDVTDPRSLDEAAVMRFFRTSTSNLVTAEANAGVAHHVVLSIVGVDRIDGAYFRAKLAQEQLTERSAVPFTIVRATQLFDFIGTITDAATDGDTVRVPPVRVRPVATEDVATTLVDVALAAPVNGVIEVAGPEELALGEVVRRWLAAQVDPRTVVVDPTSRYFGADLDDGSLLPSAGATSGSTRLQTWLDRTTRLGAASRPSRTRP